MKYKNNSKNSKYNDLEDMVSRFQPIYNEIINILDVKYIPTTTIGSTLPPGIYEVTDAFLVLKSLHPKEVKVNFTNDDIRPK